MHPFVICAHMIPTCWLAASVSHTFSSSLHICQMQFYQSLHHTVCKSFSLAIGEGICDVQLPLASRILDVLVMMWIPCSPSCLSFYFYLWFSLKFMLLVDSLSLSYYSFTHCPWALPSAIPNLLPFQSLYLYSWSHSIQKSQHLLSLSSG